MTTIQTLASGKVADKPFARLYYTLWVKKISGELIVETQGRQIRSLWKDGLVWSAESPLPSDSPARLGLAKGYVTKNEISKFVADLQGKTSLESLAVILEQTDLPPQKSEALKHLAVLQAASRQLAFEDATYVLNAQSSIGAVLQKGIHPKNIIADGLRQHYSVVRLNNELAPLGSSALQLKDGIDVEDFGFDDNALGVVSLLRNKPMTIEQLMAEAALDPSIVLSVVYVLVASDSALLTKATAKVAPPSAQTAAPAAKEVAPKAKPTKKAVKDSSVRIDEIRKTIESKIKDLNNDADYFRLLGVDVDVDGDASALQKTYFGLAKQLHPDKLQAMGLEDLKEDAQRLFAEVNKAFSVLSNPKKAKEYRDVLAQGGAKAVQKKRAEEDKAAMKILKGEEHFFLGQASLRRSQFDKAKESFEEAVECNPSEGEYFAHLGWCVWCLSEKESGDLKESMMLLDKAQKLSPKNPIVQFRKGQIFKQNDEVTKAIKCFEEVLQARPNHHEAASELRILKTRENKDGSKKTGIFSRKS